MVETGYAPSVLALSTAALPAVDPRDRPSRLMRLGAEALALGAETEDRDALTAALGGSRFPIVAVAVPSPPRLGAPDRREQREAVVRAEREIDRANRLECRFATLELGKLDASGPRGLEAVWAALIDAFARGHPIDDLLREAHRMRAAVVRRHLDGMRRSLDVLLPLAQRRGTLLGLLPAHDGRSLGLAEEIRELCLDYASGPLGGWRATDREHRLSVTGASTGAWPDALGVDLADAAGLLGALPPGKGEVDFVSALAGLPRDAPRILGRTRATEPEVRRSLEDLGRL